MAARVQTLQNTSVGPEYQPPDIETHCDNLPGGRLAPSGSML
jgi:hypothetical protein